MAHTDLDKAMLERGLEGRVVGSRLLLFDVLISTMEEARRLAEGGSPEGTVVIADEQTAGRGRFNRPWIAPPGQNILLSVVLRPPVSQLCYVNMAASLAVSGAIGQVCDLDATIKWPNDVRVNGRKVSGILVESVVEAGELRYAVLGIGVNVNVELSRFPKIAPIATSLRDETGRVQDRTAVTLALLRRLDDLYVAVRSGRSLRDQWADQLDTLGRTVRVRWGNQTYDGLAREVDDEGNLVLARPDGTTVTVVAGEVTLQS